MSYTIFIDGQEGTTGLKLYHHLAKRSDIEILMIDPDKRKSVEERSKLINEADLLFLCLPDEAAIEAVSLVNNEKTKIINASSIYRTAPHWIYGLPELKHQREYIRNADKVSVPGCHATGFIAALRPLIDCGIVPRDYPISCYSITGYSGAGKRGIEAYENEVSVASQELHVPRHYALKHNHKHLPEMKMYAGLDFEPLFTPIIANYAQGIAMSVPLRSRMLLKNASPEKVHEVLTAYYESERFVTVMPFDSEAYLDEGQFLLTACNHTNALEIFIFGRDDHISIIARYDNLGKGASGAAIQNMNLMLGFDEGSGLVSNEIYNDL